MKNLFLTLAFVFATALTFANTLQLEKIQRECVTVITSCGIYGSACGNSTAELVELAVALDKWVC